MFYGKKTWFKRILFFLLIPFFIFVTFRQRKKKYLWKDLYTRILWPFCRKQYYPVHLILF